MAPSPNNRPKRIVVFIQENKTTDFYFPTLAEWGADVVNNGNLLSDAPDFDQPHDRNSWVYYKMGDYPGARMQVEGVVITKARVDVMLIVHHTRPPGPLRGPLSPPEPGSAILDLRPGSATWICNR